MRKRVSKWCGDRWVTFAIAGSIAVGLLSVYSVYWESKLPPEHILNRARELNRQMGIVDSNND